MQCMIVYKMFKINAMYEKRFIVNNVLPFILL